MAQLDAITLVITPQGEHYIGYHHDQRGALGYLLVQAEQHAEHRNGYQPATNAKQPTHGAQSRTQYQVHH